jgi:hypothetical protein
LSEHCKTVCSLFRKHVQMMRVGINTEHPVCDGSSSLSPRHCQFNLICRPHYDGIGNSGCVVAIGNRLNRIKYRQIPIGTPQHYPYYVKSGPRYAEGTFQPIMPKLWSLRDSCLLSCDRSSIWKSHLAPITNKTTMTCHQCCPAHLSTRSRRHCQTALASMIPGFHTSTLPLCAGQSEILQRQ